MAQTSINVRMDENLKQQFDTLCNELGLNMSTAINIFAKTMVRQQRIPFDVGLEVPNAETRQVMDEVARGIGLSRRFSSVAELMEDLDA